MGEDKAWQYANANESAITAIENNIRENNIECGFKRLPAYIYTQSDKYIKDIEEEAQVAASLGISAASVGTVPLPFPVKAALRFDNQAHFHPVKYLLPLAAKITESGSYIFEKTRGINIETDKLYSVITHTGKKVKAAKVIIASHYPFFDGGGQYFSRVSVSRGYAIGVTMQDKFPDGMFISAEKPGHSLRSQPYGNGELIILGGEGHKTGQDSDTKKHYTNLINWAKQTFQITDVPYKWSAQDYSTQDGVPYVGHLDPANPDLYVAFGFNKWGMTNSTAAAMLIRDLITIGDSPWKSVYDPSFLNRISSGQNTIADKKHVPSEPVAVKVDQDMKIDEGKVIDVNDQRTGGYRDTDNQLYLRDLTCTHMRCELEWNNAERTWDCPCHGSRFDFMGNVVEGPALCNIEPADGN